MSSDLNNNDAVPVFPGPDSGGKKLKEFFILLPAIIFAPDRTVKKLTVGNWIWPALFCLGFIIFFGTLVYGMLVYFYISSSGLVLYSLFLFCLLLCRFCFFYGLIVFVLVGLTLGTVRLLKQKEYHVRALFSTVSLFFIAFFLINFILFLLFIPGDTGKIFIGLIALLLGIFYLVGILIRKIYFFSPKITLVLSCLILLVSAALWIPLNSLFQHYPLGTYHYPAGSMSPTLTRGDRFVADNLYYFFYPKRRGDIIIFRSKQYHKVLIAKRLVGLPGESIQIKYPYIYINGQKIDTLPFDKLEYLNINEVSPIHNSGGKAFKIPDNCYFVLGDNSRNSNDSRFWGALPAENIIGKVIFIWAPVSRIRSLMND